MRIADLAGKRVAIWGYGREGKVAFDVLARRLPGQMLTLFCSEAEASLVKTPVDLVTSPPDAEALKRFDVVIKSPGISPYKEPIPEAQAAGVRFTSGTALWFAERPDVRVIAVTGTKGKSTTSAMIAHVARALGIRTALAGNIGLPLLDLLNAQADLWVVELSSFQTGDAGTVEVGVINNLYEEHLDWHGSRERYAADKLRLATVARTLVVGAQHADVLARTSAHPRRVLFGEASGWHVRDGDLYRGSAAIDPSLSALRGLPGMHNALNACAALSALDAILQFDDARALAAAHSLADFRGLPHRLQRLGLRDDIEYINDSISTTPYASIEALRSLHGRAVTILVGGFDRGVDWQPFVDFVSGWPCEIVTMGANGSAIASALEKIRDPSFGVTRATKLGEALRHAQSRVTAGGVILLSPGAPSFDQFHDYAERGRDFARLAGFDPAAISEIEGLGIA